MRYKLLFIFLVIISSAFAASEYSTPINSHHDPVAPVILGVTGILFFALIGRFLARRIDQPSVLGELIMGIILGNVGYYFSFDFIEILRVGPVLFDITEATISGIPITDAANKMLDKTTADSILQIIHEPQGPALIQVAHTVDVFSRYGIIFLLFLVGLDTNITELSEAGAESIKVAIIGVVFPFALGFLFIWWALPEYSLNADLFVAATLGATSIGITASVLQELNIMKTKEARIIIGAAVFDDILGLILLAVVTGIVISGGIDVRNIITIIMLSLLFMLLAFGMGPRLLNILIRLVGNLSGPEAKLFVAFIFVMILAWFANSVGLATIVGAFAAGVILQDGYFEHWHHEQGTKTATIKEIISPIEHILAPIFFVLMGIQVKLEMFVEPRVFFIAGGLTVAAIIGKLASGIGVHAGTNRLSVGFGMMPRGEVGLIFAAIGKGLGVITDEIFAGVILMVILTTLLAPPLLRWNHYRTVKTSEQ